MKRVFLGIDLNEELKMKIEEFKRINQLNKLPIKLVEPANSHIAIKFLGEHEEGQIEQIDKIIKKLPFDFHELTVEINGLLFFPNLQFAKVIALKVEGDEFTEFGHLIIGHLEQLPFVSRENRRYTPHITIGRIKTILSKPDQVKLNDLKFNERYTLTSFQLFQSQLTASGPIYSVIFNYHL